MKMMSVFAAISAGALLELTPEYAVEIQEAIGSDIMMCLDHLPPTTAPRPLVEEAMARTTRWALRCLKARTQQDRALFAIIQGGTEKDLRTRHVEELCGHDFDGFAIGGLSVGESIPEMYEALGHTAPQMPKNKPRYLMGVGTPVDLVEASFAVWICLTPCRPEMPERGIFVDRGRQNSISVMQSTKIAPSRLTKTVTVIPAKDTRGVIYVTS